MAKQRTKTEVIEHILFLAPQKNREELGRLSIEHLEEISYQLVLDYFDSHLGASQ